MSQKHSKVFISYSHDSPEHSGRVLKLSQQLRRDGIDCHIIDRYETSPPNRHGVWLGLGHKFYANQSLWKIDF